MSSAPVLLLRRVLVTLWLLAWLVPLSAEVAGGETTDPPPDVGKNVTEADLGDFYDYSCSANTFAPSLSSFSTIWALLNAMVIVAATIIFLMYVCFNKFVAALS